MKLTSVQLRNLKTPEKTRKIFDGAGLYIELTPAGGKYWRWKYYSGGKEKRLALGVYPAVSLKIARQKANDARKLLAQGVDPGAQRKAMKDAHRALITNSFEVVARECIAVIDSEHKPETIRTKLRRLERYVFPSIGRKPLKDITAPELLAIARSIEAGGLNETAHKVVNYCSQVFRYAVQTGRADHDPAAALRGALKPRGTKNFPTVTDPARVGELLRMFDQHDGRNIVVRNALRLLPLVFVRPGELAKARWSDIDFNKAEWRYTATKTKKPHIVPLSRQAVEILRELEPLSGNGEFVFPSLRTMARPMSDGALSAALTALGIAKTELVPHGFRAMARTMLDERLNYRVDYIEQQLAHTVKDPLGRAYNRTKHLEQRRKMMQAWADYLDKLKAGGKVIPFEHARKQEVK